MKKTLAILLTLALLCGMSALAELGSADVAMNGNLYHILLESVEIRDGKLYIATSGMAQTMAFGANGVQLAADIVPVYGEERLYASEKDVLFGADVTYRFDRDTLPDSILMIPTQDPENPVTLWENPDEESAIPDELVGQWTGVGTPKNGGTPIDLSIIVNADGSGEYTFDQGDYHESYPFTISNDDSRFSVDIPATSMLGSVGGTWALEDGKLLLDITSEFTGGGSYSYTAECYKAEAGAATDDAFASAEPGDPVRLGDAAFELQLFTMAQDNWDMLSASTGNPFPAQGEVYLLRFALVGKGEALTPETIENEIAPAMSLYSEADGSASRIFEVVTPSEEATRVFDILFYCENFYALEDLELLCDGVLYPLSDLPGEDEPLPVPPVSAEDVERLNALHQKARTNTADDIGEARCAGNVVVAVYNSKEDETPDVLTATSDHYRYSGFPMEYRADSLETADWAAIIYPTYKNVGMYSLGGAANRTTTWLSLIDLATERQYDLKVAINEPPQTLFNNNGTGASGAYEPEKAVEKLAELIGGEQGGTTEPETEPAGEPEPEDGDVPASEVTTEAVLTALNDDTYRATYDALLAGEVIEKGSKGDTAKGVQQTLVAFGQDIAVDGNVGPKTIAALNAVQAAFGLPETESLDAEGYATLLPRLLIVTDPDAADVLLMGSMDAAEYDYMRACALVARGKYASAKALFEECGWGDCQARAEACVQPWPKTGVLYKNPEVKGSSAELAVQFNTEADTAMLVKVYTHDGVLARTMFIGGTGKATCSLPAGTYVIKDGVGKNWYGEEEAFGERPEGQYEIMTFEGGSQEVTLEKNYRSTITVNVQEENPAAEGVGSDWESWSDF